MSLSTLAFITYFLILLGIVWITYKRKTSEEDFLLGKRSLNFYVTALSAHASDMSSWLFMAFPSLIFLHGPNHAWIAVGLLIGMFLNWQWVAPKLRKETERLKALTISGYLSKRLNDRKGIVLLVTGLMSLIFFTIYISSGLVAMGEIFEDVFQISYFSGISIGIFVIILYTTFGGYVAVAWTDLFQALFLLLCIIAVPIYAWFHLPANTPIASPIELLSLHGAQSLPLFDTFLLICSMGIGYFGQLHILTKFMGIKKAEEMTKAKWVGISWQLLSLIAAVIVGLIGAAYFSQGGAPSNPELVFVRMVKSLFNPFISAFILCAILAAIISTMDSQVLVVASVLTEDFYKRFWRPSASGKELLLISRFCVLLTCLLAFSIAALRFASIWDLVSYAWSGLGACFGPLILFCLHSRRLKAHNALLGILSGAITVGIWSICKPVIFGAEMFPLVPGFVISSSIIYITSRWNSPIPSSAHLSS